MSEIVDFGKANLIHKATGEVVVSDVGTFHRGKGFFNFIPEADTKYVLDINLGGAKGRVQRELPDVMTWMAQEVGF